MSTRNTLDWPRVVLRTCRRIEAGPESAALAGLAAAEQVSPSELQRQFKRRLGASPKAYAQAMKLHRLGRGISRESSTLQATLAAGFESSAAAYATVGDAFGVAPGRLRGPLEIGWWLGLSELGWMLLAATRNGICWLAFGGSPESLLGELNEAFPRARFHNDEPRLRGWFEQVREFVLLPHAALDLPLDVRGTAFQACVWRALRQVPLGETVTYGELARWLSSPAAGRAVARACASNKVALLIPCHRVVAAGGRLAGYRWGTGRKADLLRREGAAVNARDGA